MAPNRARNIRMLVILASIALAFFVGIIAKIALFGQ
ncbi:MAG: cytochrome oxidase small assembly protein [Rhodocyclaceae bacterium]